jgi:hypothetical protein
MRLLACIAYHHSPERLFYLKQTVLSLLDYPTEVDVIVDTNEDFDCNILSIKKFIHKDLTHPFHLTGMHRKHILEQIDNYDYFMYIEDDMTVRWDAFKNYIENFNLLYPNYVPSFIRIEQKNHVKYVSDVLETQVLEPIEIGGKTFHAFPFPYNYHAFWIMPQKELKESLNPNFTELSDGREFNAMYVGWGLGKKCLVEIENGQVAPLCYSYHLPNNYALGESRNGKIESNKIFI